MLPRTKALALALLLMASAAICALLVVPEKRSAPVMADVADVWYTVSINVTVTDETGRLMDGALVGIRDNSSGPWTTVNGNVLITGLADNSTSYTLWANKTGYLNSVDTPVSVLTNSTTNVTLVVTGGSVWGFVTSQLGFISDAIVSVGILGYETNVSPVDGTYSLEGVPSGNYTVVASAPGYDPDTRNVTFAAGKTVRQDFKLYSREGWISGFVFHAVTNLPLSDANVSVTTGNSTITVPNRPDGSYLIDNLPEGTYVVMAQKEGFFDSMLPAVFVSRNGTANVNFTLNERPTLIYGTVKSGSYLQPGVNISIVGTAVFNVSDMEGQYTIDNLTAGIYSVSAQLEGYALALVDNVLLPVGGQVRVDIELTALPGAIVRGEVLEKDSGTPLTSVTVTIVGSDGKQRVKETNFRGQFEFTGLADGNYTLQFEATGYRPLEVGKINVRSDTISNDTYYMMPERTGFTGFIFGFDLAHSMMILALFVTIMILAAAVYLRIRTFQAPENAPAIYDQAEELAEGQEKTPGVERGAESKEKKTRKKKDGGSKPPVQ